MSYLLHRIGDVLQIVADWWREIAGWLLLLLGLFLFYECYELLRARRVFEAGPLSIIGIVIFRGGIHLLKVGVAARICRDARERTKRSEKKPISPLANRGS